jgi:LPS-assembly protein
LEELNGQERLMLSIGQIYYFKNRIVTAINPALAPTQLAYTQDVNRIRKQRVSPLAAQGVYHLQAAWTVSAGQQWDPYKTSANQSLLGIQYHPEPLNVINLRYIFVNKNFARIDRQTGRPERLNQSDLSTAWGLTEQWRVLGRWRYDMNRKRSAEQLFGIEHQGCCTAVRLTLNRYLQLNDTTVPSDKRYETGIFLQFVFKGLGGVGHNRMGSVLKEAIPGYEWRGENF